jgi:hypothetical protein
VIGLADPGAPGMDEQFSINLRIKGKPETGLSYEFHSPSLNARTSLPSGKGVLHVITRPSAAKESFRGYLSFTTVRIPPELRGLAERITFSKEVRFEVDFSDIIRVDYKTREQGNYIVYTPVLQYISPRTFEWKSGNQLLSTDQVLRLPKQDADVPVRLVVNGLELRTHQEQSGGGGEKISGNTAVEKPVMNKSHEEIGSQLARAETFGELQRILSAMRDNGQAVWGRKTDFLNPRQCWVLMVNRESQQVVHVLQPDVNGRTDKKSGKTYIDFENELKGLIAIWLELY